MFSRFVNFPWVVLSSARTVARFSVNAFNFISCFLVRDSSSFSNEVLRRKSIWIWIQNSRIQVTICWAYFSRWISDVCVALDNDSETWN
jgi:hypothetical protein